MVEASFNLFDAIVLSVLGLSALISFYRGFVREFFSLFTWIGAFIITIYAFAPVSDALKEQMDNELVVHLIAGLGTYMAALILLSIGTSMVSKFIKSGKEVGALDNFLGLIFGIARGGLMIAIGYITLSSAFSRDGMPESVRTAITRPYVEQVAEWVRSAAPEYIKDLETRDKDADDEAADAIDSIGRNKQEPQKDSGASYQFESMEKLQQLINRKSGDASE